MAQQPGGPPLPGARVAPGGGRPEQVRTSVFIPGGLAGRRVFGRPVAFLALVILVAPFAAGALPPASATDTDAEIVSRHSVSRFEPVTFAQHNCNSGDPAVGIVSTDLTSRLMHEAGDGVTTFTLHLDAVPGDLECPAIDLEFTAALAYPPTSGITWSSFTTTCGAPGSIVIYHHSQGTVIQFFLDDMTGVCLVPGFYQGGFLIGRLQQGPAAACSPLVVLGCAGVIEREPPMRWGECDGQAESTSVTLIADVITARQQCHPWTDGKRHAIVSDGFFGFVEIDATDDSCTIRDNLAGLVTQPCPEEVRAAIYDQDWGHILE